jgi:hypothetical protein
MTTHPEASYDTRENWILLARFASFGLLFVAFISMSVSVSWLLRNRSVTRG